MIVGVGRPGAFDETFHDLDTALSLLSKGG